MSNRPAVKSAFEGLRPSIVREPARTVIAPHDESKLLESVKASPQVTQVEEPKPVQPTPEKSAEEGKSFHSATLLTKKKREVLVPVTFRIPQSLKEKLNEIAKQHELNQTDLINEGIELNLQRYR